MLSIATRLTCAEELLPFRHITAVETDPRALNVYRVEKEDGSSRYVVWGHGDFTVPAGVGQMTSVVPDNAGHFDWHAIAPGQTVPLAESPLLLK